jgi:SAM-dependent methyltransferase
VDLDRATDLCRVLGDATRVRLLAVLSQEELSVAELTEVLQLPQSRVSTHLARLREAEMVRDRREGGSSFYVIDAARMPSPATRLWSILADTTEDAVLAEDVRRARELVRKRNEGSTWADSVAGNMVRHYSPGRTWEAAARAVVGLLRLGDVLDIASGDGAIAEMIAPRSRSVTCLDHSARVVAKGQERLSRLANVRFVQGDMHRVPFPDASFDAVLLMSALPYADDPPTVFREAARLVRPDGLVVGATLKTHPHRATVARYNHVHLGFEVDDVADMMRAAGLVVEACEVTSRERRLPGFEVITFTGRSAAGSQA